MTEPLRDQPAPAEGVQDLPDFGMTTDEGNGRVDLLVREVAALVGAGGAERREVVVALADGVRAISGDHPEVLDTTVRDGIVRELQPAFATAGWQVLAPFEF